jgi:hypothetical protein
MLQNLQTSRYNDGTPLLTNLSEVAFANTNSDACKLYQDKLENKIAYGCLYNGYAAVSGKLPP